MGFHSRDALKIDIVQHGIGARQSAALTDQHARFVPLPRPVSREEALMERLERQEFRIGAGQGIAEQLMSTNAASDLGLML